jgi:gamma-glutamyltranspeptidase/glutathione hydrolase
MRRFRFILIALLAVWTAPSLAQQAADQVAPEAVSGLLAAQSERQPVQAEIAMIAAANPLAVEAGARILAEGGSAADAAVAVQLMLGLVEPQSSGLGGGAFLLYWDNAEKRLTTLDGRETAPMAARPTLFQDDAGEPLKFFDAVVGGRSVGVPGTPRLLAEMHERWGKQPWKQLFHPAIEKAREGFTVSPRLAGLIANDGERLKSDPVAAAYFFDGAGEPLQEGATLRNLAYAGTLSALAENGMDAFYSGTLADAIVEKVRGAADNPGVLAHEDLARYRIVERQPVCVDYRQYQVCGMGPPSSGGLTVGQILGLLQAFDLGSLSPDDAHTWRLIGDASRLAFADRGRYMADSDFVPMPVKGLLDPAYLAERAKLLRGDMALESVTAGEPQWDHAFNYADDEAIELPSTSHFVIQDQAGNIVSMTTTIENGFGSRLMVAGFMLNNELTDFSFRSHRDGVPVANRVEPGKRPRSSMAPTIVLQQGQPVLALGSPGGSRIIPYVAKTLIAILDWRMDVQAAIDMPHLVNRFGTYDLEKGTAAEAMAPALEALGYKVNVRDLNSGIHAIALWGGDLPGVSVQESDAPFLAGGADSRREGAVFGQGTLKCEPLASCIQ